MADRVIRDELWHSLRWLDLPTDTHRLVYISLLPVADDFGNLEGGQRRLYRWMQGFSQVKSEADSIKIMSDLADADMVRRYEVDSREFWHLPRTRPHRQYLVRHCPLSPWCDQNKTLGKDKRVFNRGLAKKVSDTSPERSNDVAQGVGVGVGVGVGEGEGRKAVGVSESPTRGRRQVKPIFKSLPPDQNPSNPADIERRRKMGEALVRGDTEAARKLRDEK